MKELLPILYPYLNEILTASVTLFIAWLRRKIEKPKVQQKAFEKGFNEGLTSSWENVSHMTYEELLAWHVKMKNSGA